MSEKDEQSKLNDIQMVSAESWKLKENSKHSGQSKQTSFIFQPQSQNDSQGSNVLNSETSYKSQG